MDYPPKKSRLLSVALIFLLFSCIISPKNVYAQESPSGDTLWVSTTADNGVGSLRNALLNARAGDTIRFDPTIFTFDVPQSIEVQSVLPFLNSGFLTIDGSDAGVILDGSNVIGEGGDSENSLFSGLVITSDHNVVRNLTIVNFPGNGIFIQNGNSNLIGGGSDTCTSPCNIIGKNQFSGILIENGHQNIVKGNFLGINTQGDAGEGNGLNGIRIVQSSDNLIGGYESGAGNLIGANSIGFEILGPESIENMIIGNIIGLDSLSQKKIGNIHAGISIAWETSKNSFENNLISGNEIGIVIEKGSFGNVLKNNFIGTNEEGIYGLGNTYAGIILSSTYDNYIGPGNMVMWNGSHGVVIENPTDLIPTGNRITQNEISNNFNENIYLADSITEWIPAPRELKYSNGTVSGFALGNQIVELYTDDRNSGGKYLATIRANDRGYFFWLIPDGQKMEKKVSALSFEENGTTSVFSNAVGESEDLFTSLPGVVGPAEVNTTPKVLYWNFIFSFMLLVYFKVMTNIFNKNLKKYGELITDYIIAPFQKFITKLTKGKPHNISILQNRWVNWLIFLIMVALIQAWLNPTKIPFVKHISTAFTIFVSAGIIGIIKEIGERLARSRIKQPFIAESTKVHWVGVIIAGISTGISRLIQFTPGFILGSVDVFSYKPSILETRNAAIRIMIVRGSIFLFTLLGWLMSSQTGTFSPGLTIILQMIFTVAVQGLFFELLPFTEFMDGSKLIRWSFWSWLSIFLPISFFAFWLVFNPNGSGIKAIQQNSIITLMIVLLFLTITVFTSNLIFKRMERGRN